MPIPSKELILIAAAIGGLVLCALVALSAPFASVWMAVTRALTSRASRAAYTESLLPLLIRLTERVGPPFLELRTVKDVVELRMRYAEEPDRPLMAWHVWWHGNCPFQFGGDGFVLYGPVFKAATIADPDKDPLVKDTAVYKGGSWAARAVLDQVAGYATLSESAVLLLTDDDKLHDLYDTPRLQDAYSKLMAKRATIVEKRTNRVLLDKYLAIPVSAYAREDREYASELIDSARSADEWEWPQLIDDFRGLMRRAKPEYRDA